MCTRCISNSGDIFIISCVPSVHQVTEKKFNICNMLHIAWWRQRSLYVFAIEDKISVGGFIAPPQIRLKEFKNNLCISNFMVYVAWSKLWWSEKVTLWWKSQEGEIQEKEGKESNLLFPICQGVVIFPVKRSVTDLWALSAHTDTGSSSMSWSHRNTGHWPNNIQEPRPFREVKVSHLKSPWSAVKLMVVGVPVKSGSPDCAPISCACNWCYKFEVCCDSRSLNFTAVVAFPF